MAPSFDGETRDVVWDMSLQREKPMAHIRSYKALCPRATVNVCHQLLHDLLDMVRRTGLDSVNGLRGVLYMYFMGKAVLPVW